MAQRRFQEAAPAPPGACEASTARRRRPRVTPPSSLCHVAPTGSTWPPWSNFQRAVGVVRR
eukprot:7464827-Lingulodinium_polyedra.AAC.1